MVMNAVFNSDSLKKQKRKDNKPSWSYYLVSMILSRHNTRVIETKHFCTYSMKFNRS